jgi:hypothetical protein
MIAQAANFVGARASCLMTGFARPPFRQGIPNECKEDLERARC